MENIKDLRPAFLEINLDNIRHNYKKIRGHIGKNTEIMAVIKANAYGHGSVSIARELEEVGVNIFAVSILSEAIELRNAGIRSKILVLNYTPKSQFIRLLEQNISQSIYSYRDAKDLSDLAIKEGKEAHIHIKIDTGMNRLGFLVEDESIGEIEKISRLEGIRIEGIFTHFACSDEKNKDFSIGQFKKFKWIVDELEKKEVHIPKKHVSNSGAVLDMPDYNLDIIRPGLILYGYYPSEYVSKNLDLRPAMALKAKISHIKIIKEGQGISYGQKYITEKETKVATIPIGYGDGYSRLLTGRSHVSIKGKTCKIIGTICMDQMMIDVSHIGDLNRGDEVVLFGYEDNHPRIEDIAKKLDTINYEIICMMNRRLPRIYIKNKKTDHIVDYILD